MASIDRTHVLTLNYLWDLPQVSRIVAHPLTRALLDGWSLMGITSFISGAPTGVSMSEQPTVNITGGGDGARPIMIANATLPKGQRTFNEFFNINAFAEPPIGNQGNAPAVVFRGPGVNNWNISLVKNIRISERLKGQLRAETYNTFNHTQFSGVNTSVLFNPQGVNINTQLGQITSARDPRIMQLAVRFSF
jgi:hypothetical protein